MRSLFRSPGPRLLRAGGLSLTVAALLVLSPAVHELPLHALPKFDPPDLEIDPMQFCGEVSPRSQIIGRPYVVGYSVVGFSVVLDAGIVKIRWGAPGCGTDYVVALSSGQFDWDVVSRPAGSTAVLDGPETLNPRLLLDREGTYLVRLTVCRNGCPVGDLVQPPESFDLTIQAVFSAPLAPETVPVLPTVPLAPRSEQLQNHCSLGAGVASSQWYAVKQIEGPDDYERLEGFVERSRVSRKDTPMNHDSQDFTFHVRPDGDSRRLLFAGSEDTLIEVEWERRELPEPYRPTRGDRVSVFGHWIYDCAHDKKTEIHPPVGVAVHRPRPIAIPGDEPFEELGGERVGDGVYVPGVITDVFFSAGGGRLLDCSVDTGLKNADLEEVTLPAGTSVPTCIPPVSLDRVFEFNVYLPRDPRKTMAAAGFATPPVPLYVRVSLAPQTDDDDEPAPLVCEPVETPADGITYLKCRFDLRGKPPGDYRRRVVAGWVLPADDNWGLGRWRLLLNRLNVTNDGDGRWRGDGEWRLWINTNNATSDGPPGAVQEWVQIINEDVNGVVDFGGVPWRTGLDAPGRSLGPDLLRYPPVTNSNLPAPVDYGILFHSTGYEVDGATDDDAGTVSSTLFAQPGSYSEANRCSISPVVGETYASGCVRYTADYEVTAGLPLPPPRLTAAARALAAKYVLSCPKGRGDDVGVCGGILAQAEQAVATFPLEAVLKPGAPPVDISTVGPFSPGQREVAFTEMSSEEIYRVLTEVRGKEPDRVERALVAIRGFYDRMLADEGLALDAQADLKVLRASMPADLWARHFGDLPKAPHDRTLPRARLEGYGVIPSSSGGVHAKHVLVHCAVAREPNRLSLRWGGNRFDLDLALEARCEPEPLAKRLLEHPRHSWSAPPRVNAGRGIGRFNGAAGAIVEWRLVDGGGRGSRKHDTAAVVIRSGGEVVLSASGSLHGGRLTAEDWSARRDGGPGHQADR